MVGEPGRRLAGPTVAVINLIGKIGLDARSPFDEADLILNDLGRAAEPTRWSLTSTPR